MSKATEQEWVLKSYGGQKIVRAEIIDNGQGIRYYTIPESESEKVQLQVDSKEFEEMFPIVDIENVSL